MENLNIKETEIIITLINNDIASNIDYLQYLKGEEKEFWIKFNGDLKTIRNKLQENIQLVIQSSCLNNEQEDYMIESQLEQIREARK